MKSALKNCLLPFLFLLLTAGSLVAADDWIPVPPADLAMKDFALLPGTHALILYRKVEHDDKEGWEKQYYRIKIFDEEGKKYANVETDTYPNGMRVTNFEARTIRPDGTIVPFTGKPNDKLVAKYKSFSLNQKTLAIPDAQVGGIIEFRYTLKWDANMLFDSVWHLQDHLVTRDADFSLRYDTGAGYSVQWLTYFLPKEMLPKDDKGLVHLSLHNLPALEKEDYMPPESEMQARVEFMYVPFGAPHNAADYWKETAKFWTKVAEDYMNKKKAAQAEVATVTAASDAPEVKLRKLYDRVQKLRNLTYEHEKSEKEQEREKLKENNNIEDVLKHGYGGQNQLNRTYVALARAAGFDATLIRVTERNQHFHHSEVPKFDRYDTELAVVKLNGKDLYLDPGVPFCPFGMLSWEDTATYGLMLNKDGAVWQKTPDPDPAQSMQKRTAELVLDRDGELKGELSVTLQGQDALYERLQERDDDEAQRKKDLEDMFKNWLPAGTTVELAKVDDWNSANDLFVVTAKIDIPNFGAATGKRLMLPVSIFPGSDKHAFQHAKRVNPVYLRNPYREFDEITVKVPEGMQVETLPEAKSTPTAFADMSLKVSKENDSVKIDRQVVMKGYYFDLPQYANLRTFLDGVKSAGDEQVVLRAAAK